MSLWLCVAAGGGVVTETWKEAAVATWRAAMMETWTVVEVVAQRPAVMETRTGATEEVTLTEVAMETW